MHHYLQADGNINSVQAGDLVQPSASWTQIFISEDVEAPSLAAATDAAA